jgi:hypothetical protein
MNDLLRELGRPKLKQREEGMGESFKTLSSQQGFSRNMTPLAKLTQPMLIASFSRMVIRSAELHCSIDEVLDDDGETPPQRFRNKPSLFAKQVLMKSQDEFEQHSIKIQRLELQTSINLDV